MRRSDIGPMGVGALVLALLVQVAALAAVPRPPLAAAALVLAEVTGRVSVVIATAAPAARPGGFGALVAGRTTAAERALTAGALGLRRRGRRAHRSAGRRSRYAGSPPRSPGCSRAGCCNGRHAGGSAA